MFYKVKNYRKGGERDLAEYRNNYRQRENKSVYGERNTYEKKKNYRNGNNRQQNLSQKMYYDKRQQGNLKILKHH